MPLTKNDMGLYERDIDGKKYELSKWSADDSLDCLCDLGNIVGKPLGMAVKSYQGLDAEIDGDAIGMIIEALTSAVGDKKAITKSVLKRLVSGDNVLCEGRKVSYATHYTDLMHIFKVARFSLEVQYGDFLSAFPINAAGVARAMQAPQPRVAQT